MSHRRKCGCLIADNKDASVRKGFELGGYVIEFCEEHERRPKPRERTKIFHEPSERPSVRWISYSKHKEVIAVLHKRIDYLQTAQASTYKDNEELRQRIEELTQWAETPPDNMGQFQMLWRSCVRLVEKASFKAMFRHMEILEKRIEELEKEIHECEHNPDFHGHNSAYPPSGDKT